MASVFIAIDKATTENGCLKVPKNIFLIVYCHYLDFERIPQSRANRSCESWWTEWSRYGKSRDANEGSHNAQAS